MPTPMPEPEDGVHDSQLLKGVLSLALMRLLADRESYGYELVTRLHELGLTEVQDGSVYPALGRLERDGHVTSRLVASTSGAAGKLSLIHISEPTRLGMI